MHKTLVNVQPRQDRDKLTDNPILQPINVRGDLAVKIGSPRRQGRTIGFKSYNARPAQITYKVHGFLQRELVVMH
jgi:hypothetical protein